MRDELFRTAMKKLYERGGFLDDGELKETLGRFRELEATLRFFPSQFQLFKREVAEQVRTMEMWARSRGMEVDRGGEDGFAMAQNNLRMTGVPATAVTLEVPPACPKCGKSDGLREIDYDPGDGTGDVVCVHCELYVGERDHDFGDTKIYERARAEQRPLPEKKVQELRLRLKEG